jgi:hypothetical protein
MPETNDNASFVGHDIGQSLDLGEHSRPGPSSPNLRA